MSWKYIHLAISGLQGVCTRLLGTERFTRASMPWLNDRNLDGN